MTINDAILEAACFLLCARFRFVAIQAARGPLEGVEIHSIHATRPATVAHGMMVARAMAKQGEAIAGACSRSAVVGAIERGEAMP